MNKIPTVYLRDWDGNPKYVTREPNPECAWVLAGEGVPTVKWDGTCVKRDEGGKWWARREVKPGKTPPSGFVEISVDEETGKRMGWEPIESSGFARWHAEAVSNAIAVDILVEFKPGTYELVGPKVNGNPEHFAGHVLICHGWAPAADAADALAAPRDFDGLHVWLHARPFEGLVWHHEDGVRMAKLKRRDFPAQQSGEATR